MGNCMPIQKSPRQNIELQLQQPVNSKAEIEFVKSPVQEKHVPVQAHKSQLSPNVANLEVSNGTEEIYFDSIPPEASDSEDFYSVNGDFTTSCDNSPIHQSSAMNSPQPKKFISEDVAAYADSQCFASDDKKLLIELFNEDCNGYPSNGLSLQDQKKVEDCSRSSKGMPHADFRHRKVKSAWSTQCCIPNIGRSLSFSEKKMRRSLSETGGGG